MAITFTQAYETNPWARLDKNQRTWYDPLLMRPFVAQSMYRSLVPIQVDQSLFARRTNKMVFNIDFDLEPNINPIGNRDLYIEAMTSDSAQLEITTERHGGKVILHRYDEYITYWERTPGNPGLAPIVRDKLAPSMVKHLDLLARNAYLQTHFRAFAAGSNFAGIGANDVLDPEWLLQAHLRKQTRQVASAFSSGDILVLTTPGGMYALEQDPNYREERKYTESGFQSLHSAVTTRYRRCQLVETPLNILWNAGTITKQVAITAAVSEGDGGYDWANYKIGQTSATKWINVSDFEANDFKVNDIVTIHLRRANDSGVLTLADGSTYETGVAYGVHPFDGMTFQRVVKYVDTTAGACKIGFDVPINWAYDDDLVPTVGATAKAAPGGGNFQANGVDVASVYGYVTKGINIHATLFIYGVGAIVAGITQMPQVYEPVPIDDFNSVWRSSWDAFIKYQPWRPELCDVVFHAGAYDMDGTVKYGN